MANPKKNTFMPVRFAGGAVFEVCLGRVDIAAFGSVMVVAMMESPSHSAWKTLALKLYCFFAFSTKEPSGRRV
jgi:hypothetical protein